ncbi:MAG: hypothetical protein UH541_02450 [Prevotella sp.]|nr:hypothetical protein [Prevotella sp.]
MSRLLLACLPIKESQKAVHEEACSLGGIEHETLKAPNPKVDSEP